MSDIATKAHFLKNEFAATIATIAPDSAPIWGKMNVQQMVEHMIQDAFMVASGKVHLEQVTPEAIIPKMQAFMLSDKPFKENTPNSLMPSEPRPVQYASVTEALGVLQQEIDAFFAAFEADPNKIVPNPFFGNLNFDMQVQLLHKHACHHLRQFGALDQ